MGRTQISLWGSCRVTLYTCNRWIWYVWRVSGSKRAIQSVGIKINVVIANFNVRFCLGWSEMFLAVDWATGVRLPVIAVIPLHKTICRTTKRLPFPSLAVDTRFRSSSGIYSKITYFYPVAFRKDPNLRSNLYFWPNILCGFSTD